MRVEQGGRGGRALGGGGGAARRLETTYEDSLAERLYAKKDGPSAGDGRALRAGERTNSSGSRGDPGTIPLKGKNVGERRAARFRKNMEMLF